MECGQQVEALDTFGAIRMRFIYMCGGRFMVISNGLDWRNGYLLADWRGVLRELVTFTVPARMTDRLYTARSAHSGPYVAFPLSYPLSAANFAALLGVPVDKVRAELIDLAVQLDGS